ncbi:MAG: hypothetical protein ABJM06_12565 [Gilvibacter sp.]
MRSVLFVGFYLLTSLALSGQEKDETTFPEAYLGIYKGTLKITSDRGSQEVKMTFILDATATAGNYRYVLQYGDQPPRDYLLIAQEGAPGRFVVDEQNDILLDAYNYENALISIFEVQGNLITTTERFYEDFMDFEITMIKSETPKMTGGTSEEIPPVKSFPLQVIQKARLIKQ